MKGITQSLTENTGTEKASVQLLHRVEGPINHIICYLVGLNRSGKEIRHIFAFFLVTLNYPRAEQMNSCCYSTSLSHQSTALERRHDLLLLLAGIIGA